MIHHEEVDELFDPRDHDSYVAALFDNNNNRGEDTNNGPIIATDNMNSKETLINFILMSTYFALSHGSVVSCLSLAIPELGEIGSWQSGVMSLTYATSALLGATYVVKNLGSRNALVLGLALTCIYVASFFLIFLVFEDTVFEIPVAVLGALIGGVGAGFLWTAQGTYFARASEQYAIATGMPIWQSTSILSGVFAFCLLSLEVILRALSSAIIDFCGLSWEVVFGTYLGISLLGTIGMAFVHDYATTDADNSQNDGHDDFYYKVTAAWKLLIKDPKMKYMMGLNITFGISSVFMASYVNSDIVSDKLDMESKVGWLSAIASLVAAISSVIFAFMSKKSGKGIVIFLGSIAFFLVGFMFIIFPNVDEWGWAELVVVYSFQGVGRSTFEGAIRGRFADYFPYEKEGAFANIILHYGLTSTVAFFLTYEISWDIYIWAIMMTSVIGILGFWRASTLREHEMRRSIFNDQLNEGLLSKKKSPAMFGDETSDLEDEIG